MQTAPTLPTHEELRIIAQHFMIAAIWADADEGCKPIATSGALKTAELCAKEFCDTIGAHVFRRTLDAYTEAGLHPDCNGTPLAAFGHDLYLTLAGHGVGFWDRQCLEGEGYGMGGVFSLGDYLSFICQASRWREPHSSGYLEFWRGWAYFREPSHK